jgi:hypothetical protein
MTDHMSTFRITVGLSHGECDGVLIDATRVPGLPDDDLFELARLLPGAQLSVEPAEVGKGAAGPGATLVVEVLERAMNDGASVLAWGGALLAAIRWLRVRHHKRVNLDEPRTIGAVAAAQHPVLRDQLLGSRFATSVCLTGGGPGIGTDARDVWASSFVTNDGWVLILFSSPTGLVLGHAVVPTEWSGTNFRSAADLANLFDQGRPQGNTAP